MQAKAHMGALPFATAFLVIGPRPPWRVLWRLNCYFWPWLQPSVKAITHLHQLMNCLILRKPAAGTLPHLLFPPLVRLGRADPRLPTQELHRVP